MTVAEFLEKKKDEKWRIDHFFDLFALEGTVMEIDASSDPNRWTIKIASPADPEQLIEGWVYDAEIWKKIVVGQTIVLQDKFLGLPQKATVVKIGENPLPRITAAALEAEFAADKAAAVEKYKDKWLLVTGKVGGEHPKSGLRMLETAGEVKVCFKEPFTLWEWSLEYQQGEELTLVGRVVDNKTPFILLLDALPFERKAAK